MMGLITMYAGIIFNILKVIFLILAILCAIKYLTKKNCNVIDITNCKKVRKVSKKTIVIILLICFLIVTISFGQIIKYYNGYVIFCDSKNEVEIFKELLEENSLDYKVLIGSTSVKMQNENDFNTATSILEENGIGYGYVVEEK